MELGAGRALWKRVSVMLIMSKKELDLNALPGSLAPLDAAMLARYAPRFEKLRARISPEEWAVHLPWIDAIEALKASKNAVILAHNYQPPEITYGVADVIGDSLALAYGAAQTPASTIVMCGVHFMAETAKILNPHKNVLLPDLRAGCSLAESITAADVRELRACYPGAPVVTYVNTSAEVKAESDICCTSANALEVVESVPGNRVIFLPDRYLGQHVATRTRKQLILWEGACEVHERFTGAEVAALRAPGLRILAHPECPPDVLDQADFVGSTAAMGADIRRSRARRVVLITECSMASNLAIEFPDVEFTQPCNLCPHMQRITLPKIHAALLRGQPSVDVQAEVAARACVALERMLAIGRREAA